MSNFFRAQIEASLLAHWRREGTAPDHAPINLVATIRPELDALEIKLIVQLAEATIIRASTSCHADIAKAIETMEQGEVLKRGLERDCVLSRELIVAPRLNLRKS